MLQGSLDHFALDEVLSLLSSTSKTGKLDLKGNRGHGTLRMIDGSLVDATASNTGNGSEPEDVLFELLRFADGTFSFTCAEQSDGGYSRQIDELVESAEQRLADWRTIEAVVPSVRHHVAPRRDLPDDDVTLSRDEWSAIVTIAAGCAVSTVCDELDLGEVEGSRRVKGLVERGLVSLSEPKATPSFRRAGIDALRTDTLRTTATEIGIGRPEPVAGDETGLVDREVVRVAATGELSESDAVVRAITAVTSERAPLPPRPEGVVDSDGDGDAEKHGGLLMRYLKNED